MTWQRHWQIKTRDPKWLWQMAIAIVVAGAALGWLGQWLPEGVKSTLHPETSTYISHVEYCEQLAEVEKWGDLALAIPRALWYRAFPAPTAIAVLTGVCWLLFLLQAGQVNTTRGVRPWLCIVGVILGTVSTWPTLWAVWWQEIAWGLAESDEIGPGLLFFVAGVGLREEVCKLLLFLPLLPFVITRRDEREALLVAASVGLGFAINENVGYFVEDAGGSVPRFLSANLLHMSLTGLMGLAVCRAIWYPRQWAGEALGMTLLLVLAHGFYDALIVVLDFDGSEFLSFLVYLGLVYQYFRELRTWWVTQASTFSLTATVVASTALVFAMTFVYLSTLTGFDSAVEMAAIPAVESLLLMYVVLREIPEPLVD
jgi:RsiW-degrading membrane proteinase PrsW (M82 family)